MPTPSSSPVPPHVDPARWDELIESVDPGAVLVAISSWMGSRLCEHMTAEDIWQETLAMAWRDRHRHAWHGVRSYRAWLLAIARNRIRDAADLLAAKKRGGDQRTVRFSALLDSADGSLSAILPARSTTPSRVSLHAERARAMAQALAALPPEQRDVVQLALIEERTLRETAAELGVGLSTAKRRLYAGSKTFRAELERRWGGPTAAGGSGR